MSDYVYANPIFTAYFLSTSERCNDYEKIERCELNSHFFTSTFTLPVAYLRDGYTGEKMHKFLDRICYSIKNHPTYDEYREFFNAISHTDLALTSETVALQVSRASTYYARQNTVENGEFNRLYIAKYAAGER